MPRTVRVPNQNADFQFLETLRRNREKRSKAGAFFVEGVRPISQALAHGWAFRALAYSDDRPPSTWAREVLDRAGAETHFVLPGALLAQLSDRNEGSELLAVWEYG
jgi:23S rRNA (uridine2479-2'-O)-methyltransferase